MVALTYKSDSCIDLTHTLSSAVPSWDGCCGVMLSNRIDYADCQTETKFLVQDITMPAGIGTHIDSPAHCIPGAKTVADLTVAQLSAPCFVLNVSDRADEYYVVTADDIAQFCDTHNKELQGSIVLINTGWSKYWSDAQRYRNNYQFPSISARAAELLIISGVVGVGIDTLSPDTPASGYVVHQMLLKNNVFIIENVANLDALPTSGAHLVVAPLKIEGATEAPVRLFAFTHFLPK